MSQVTGTNDLVVCPLSISDFRLSLLQPKISVPSVKSLGGTNPFEAQDLEHIIRSQ